MAELDGLYPCQLALFDTETEVYDPIAPIRRYKCVIRSVALRTPSTIDIQSSPEIGNRCARRLIEFHVTQLVCADCKYRKMAERED